MDRMDRNRTRTWTIALIGGVVVALVMVFRLPLATVFSLGILLVCPLLMVGMHGGPHGGHDGHASGRRSASDDRTDEAGASPLH